VRGQHANLVVTTTTDDATGDEKPLFAFPVQVCKATENNEVRFDRATPNGSEYQQVYRDKVTGEIFETGDLIQGVRTGESFTEIPKERIKAIDEALSSKDIKVERTVDLDDVPFDRVTGAYFLQVPAKGGAHKSYRLLYESLLGTKRPKTPAKALRVTYAARSRRKLAVVYADTKAQCLVLVTLNYAATVRQPDEQILSHLNVEVDKEMVKKARTVVESLDSDEAGDWDTPTDETIAKRQELVEAALAGEGIEVEVAEETTVTEEVEAALEQSLAALG
jgi:non-homologous end joining protein Ku